MRMVHAGPVTALIAQMLLIAAIARTGGGLGRAAWVVGVTCGADHERGTGARPLPLPRRPAERRPTG